MNRRDTAEIQRGVHRLEPLGEGKAETVIRVVSDVKDKVRRIRVRGRLRDRPKDDEHRDALTPEDMSSFSLSETGSLKQEIPSVDDASKPNRSALFPWNPDTFPGTTVGVLRTARRTQR